MLHYIQVIFVNQFIIGSRTHGNCALFILCEYLPFFTNSLFKMKFDEIPSIPNVSNIINSWRTFNSSKKICSGIICTISEQAVSAMELIKNEMRSRLTEQHLKNTLQLEVSNLTVGEIKTTSKFSLLERMFIFFFFIYMKRIHKRCKYFGMNIFKRIR